MPSYYRDPAAPQPNLPRKIGVTAIIEREGLVLTDRRADSITSEWAFIGGSLEEESVLDALHREVREETGFEIANASLFGIFSDPTRIVSYADGNVVQVTSIVFRVVPLGDRDPARSHESAELRFVSCDELARLEFWPAHRPIRDAFVRRPEGVVVA